MNILITGAGGFVGSRMRELSIGLLGDGDEMILFTSRKIENFRCVLHDNYQYNSSTFYTAGVDHVDAVIHMAHFLAECHEGERAAYGNLSSINNTLRLLESLPSVPRNFVYCSSMAVYGLNRLDDIDENSTCLGNGEVYGASKIIIERLLREWAAAKSVNLQILRLSHIYGPGDKRQYTIPIWLRAAARDEPIRLFTNPSMYRNCLYIDDCCRAILRAAYLQSDNGIINLVSSHNATMLEIAQLCREISGNSHEIEIKIDGIDLKKEVGLRFSNNEKYMRLLGHEEYDMRSGLEKEHEYYVNMGGGGDKR